MSDHLKSNVDFQSLQKSAITPLIKQAVKRHQYAFRFLYPHIFQLKIGENGMVDFRQAPFTWKLIPWFLSVTIITGILGLGSCFYICTAQLFHLEKQPWIKWSFSKTLITLGMIFCGAVEIGGCILLYRSPVVFWAYRELISLEQKCINSIQPERYTAEPGRNILSRRDLLTNEFRTILKSTTKPSKRSRRIVNNDSLGYLFNSMVILGALVSLPMAIVSVASHLDPFYFMLEQFILPHPYIRSMKVIIFTPILRCVLAYFCAIEFFRTGVLGIFAVVIVVFVAVSISKKLLYVFYDKCLFLYAQLRLLFMAVKHVSEITIGVVIFGGQFASCLTLCLVFKCYNLLPTYNYSVICFFSIYLIALISLILTAATKVEIETRGLISNKLNLHYCTNRKNARKYCYFRMWGSQKSVYFSCFSYFIVESGVTLEYLKELINNFVDAVLLIDP